MGEINLVKSKRFIVSEVQLGILQTDEAPIEVKQLLINKIANHQFIGVSDVEICTESQKLLQREIIGVKCGRPRVHS